MDKSFIERNMNVLKKLKLGATGTFQETNHKITEVSYVVLLELAKQIQKTTYNWLNFFQSICPRNGRNCTKRWIRKKVCFNSTIR